MLLGYDYNNDSFNIFVLLIEKIINFMNNESSDKI